MTWKCDKCKFHHYILACTEAPYGEEACLKTGSDLWGCTPEEVADCKDYEPKAYPEEG